MVEHLKGPMMVAADCEGLWGEHLRHLQASVLDFENHPRMHPVWLCRCFWPLEAKKVHDHLRDFEGPLEVHAGRLQDISRHRDWLFETEFD